MTKKDAIKVFEDKKIRAVWDDQKEEWYFSIVDVIEVLTESERVTGGCERVHGLRHHVRFEVEHLSEAGLVDAVRACGQQLHQHAVLRHAEARASGR